MHDAKLDTPARAGIQCLSRTYYCFARRYAKDITSRWRLKHTTSRKHIYEQLRIVELRWNPDSLRGHIWLRCWTCNVWAAGGARSCRRRIPPSTLGCCPYEHRKRFELATLHHIAQSCTREVQGNGNIAQGGMFRTSSGSDVCK